MTFLSPLFLLGALAAAVPVVLHLLKREPEQRVLFSAVHLLKRAPVEHSSRRRLRELLLLALRVGALLLLALGFARPFLTSSAASTGATTVVALDTSLSMSAPGQFEKAQEAAKRAIAEAAAGDLVAVILFADSAQSASQPSADRAAAVAAIDGARAGAGGTRYRAAVNVGVDLLRGRPGRVVLVTDLQETGWDSGDRVQVPESVHISVIDVGAPPPDLAVTSVRAAGDRIVATIRNSGREQLSARVALRAGQAPGAASGAVVGESTIPVAGGDTATVGFSLPRARWVSARVDDQTGAAADNERFLVLDRDSKPTVLVITTAGDMPREGFYLEQALLSEGDNDQGYGVDGVAAAELASWDQQRLGRYVSVVLASTRALEHHGRGLLTAFLRKGGGMIVAAGTDVDGEVLQEILAGPKLSLVHASATSLEARTTRTWGASDLRHPVVRAFGPSGGALGLVQFNRVAAVRTDDCSVLARFTSGEPAMVECASGEGRALVVASDLDNRGNDFPLHATFVPFVHESVRYVTGGRPQVSEYLVADVPAGIPPTPGVATVPGAAASKIVAVNADAAESDAGRLSLAEFQSVISTMGNGAQTGSRLQAEEQEERQHIWQYVLAGMVLLMAVESMVAAKVA